MPKAILSFLVTVAALPLPLAGQAVDSTFFQGKAWRNIGPNRGGRSIAAAGVPSRPNEYYFGAVGGGLWKTTDGGVSWNPVTDGQITSSSVGAIGVSEANPDVVYIGMGEVAFRGNIMQGDGIYKSTDGGKTWKHSGLRAVQAISRIRVDKANPDLVYVAAFGKPYGPSPERGVYRSTNGGATWQRILFRNDSTAAIDLSIDPTNPNVLYAALWQAYRTPWKMSSGGAGSGLFKSVDGGDSWVELTRNPGLPRGVVGKIGVSASAAAPNRVFAIVENDSGGVFRSDDAGATWKRTNGDRKVRQRAFYYSRIYADPKLKDRVYALNVDFHRSDDGGVTFKSYDAPHGDFHDLWIDPNDNQRLLNSSDGGGAVSTNGGRTWTGLRYPTAQAYRVATTKDFPYHVCGAQQDNSTFCVVSSGWANLTGEIMDSPADFIYQVGGGESGYIAPDPRDPNVFFAGSQGALLTRYDRSNGESRDIQVYPRFFSGEPASALPERWQWTYPIVFSPIDPNIIYTSSQHLWKTTNDGQSWERISPDLTRADPATLGYSGGPITHDMNGPEIYATIFTVAPSFHDGNTIWTGSDDGVVHLTRDGGKTWKNVTPKDLPEFSRLSLIEASRHQPGTAFLAAKRYQLDDRAPHIFKTTDYGGSWTRITTGIRPDAYVHAVREDPKRAGLLYAGTEHGIYLSWDAGANWQSLSLNLPDTQIPDLVVEENDLVIATHGRSMWLLEDIGFLREIEPGAPRPAVKLYQPRNPVRGVYPASFHYYLERPADSVKVEILDAQGAVIRSFVGAKPDSARLRADSLELDRLGCDVRPGRPPSPPTRAGMNRFVWDGRYPGAVDFPCMILWSARPEAGPKAPPGEYQARLTANGVAQTQRFRLLRDPRLKQATDADLALQFALASRIRDQEQAANAAVIRIRAIKSQIDDRIAKAPPLASAGNSLKQKLTAIEDEIYQGRSRSSQDLLNYPIRLNNRIAALRRSVESGDAKPTAGAHIVLRELSADLAKQLTALDAILTGELEAFNRQVAARRLDRIALNAS